LDEKICFRFGYLYSTSQICSQQSINEETVNSWYNRRVYSSATVRQTFSFYFLSPWRRPDVVMRISKSAELLRKGIMEVIKTKNWKFDLKQSKYYNWHMAHSGEAGENA
jgi:hypothetical protein